MRDRGMRDRRKKTFLLRRVRKFALTSFLKLAESAGARSGGKPKKPKSNKQK